MPAPLAGVREFTGAVGLMVGAVGAATTGIALTADPHRRPAESKSSYDARVDHMRREWTQGAVAVTLLAGGMSAASYSGRAGVVGGGLAAMAVGAALGVEMLLD